MDARPHIEMALEMEPKMASAHVCMGNILRAEGRPDLAAGSYAEAIALRDEYPEAHYNMALTFIDRGMQVEALEHLELALEQKPGWGIAHRSIANLFLANGRYEESLEHFEAAIEDLGDDAAMRNDMGVALQSLGRPEEALENYLAAMELAPNFFRPHLNRANMALDYGNQDVALSEYEAALRLAPSQVEPTAKLARFLATTPVAELRDPNRAIALAERAVDLTGGQSARALEVLAAAYASAERFPAALSAASKAQMRARAAGDEALATAIDAQIAHYALGEPLVVAQPRAPAQPPVEEPTADETGDAASPEAATPEPASSDPDDGTLDADPDASASAPLTD